MALVIDFPKPIGQTEPDYDLIEMLEDFLKRARSGEVQSLVVAAANRDGTPSIGMRMDKGASAAVIGALRVAEIKITRLLEEDLS